MLGDTVVTGTRIFSSMSHCNPCVCKLGFEANMFTETSDTYSLTVLLYATYICSEYVSICEVPQGDGK